MIYTESEQKEHIREIQYYLYSISSFNSMIPEVIPDGFYNQQTQDAVLAFQKYYNIPQSGEVDKLTWDTIVAVYKGYFINTPEMVDVYPSVDFVIRPGQDRHLIYTLQVMLSAAAQQFSNLPDVPVTGEYDKATSDAVKRIQYLSLLPVTGEVDKFTWNFVVKLFNYIQQKKAVAAPVVQRNRPGDSTERIPTAF
ncbi:MAG: peptidoglycan-binding domain-containing protein [Oscillospiraceae bacterium]|nr:peptidoglycan-binding domain-containing protein [Oscillospiraceae bacterium]